MYIHDKTESSVKALKLNFPEFVSMISYGPFLTNNDFR
jgi:hypothetical protein